MIFRLNRDGKITLTVGAETIRCTTTEFQQLEPDFEYTEGDELWSTARAYLIVNGNQGPNPYDRSAYLTAEKLLEYAAALEPEIESVDPQPVRDWEQFALLMNGDPEWRSLVKVNGAAGMLARYVADRDIVNARTYYQFLLSEGDLTASLQTKIAAAAADCNLSDLLQQIAATD